MREVKFRAWNADEKKMHDVASIDWVPNGELRVETDTDHDDYELIDPPLMQFTGLHDKNGKEIYEGDIIRDHFGTRVVHDIAKLPALYDDWVEVIGNIYQKPDLLN